MSEFMYDIHGERERERERERENKDNNSSITVVIRNHNIILPSRVCTMIAELNGPSPAAVIALTTMLYSIDCSRLSKRRVKVDASVTFLLAGPPSLCGS